MAASIAAVMVLSGCAASTPNEGGAARPPTAAQETTAPAEGEVRFEAVAQDMARFLLGESAARSGRAGAAAVVGVGRFVNHTEAEEREFASFREAFVAELRRACRTWGVMIEPSMPGVAPGRHALHAAVIPIRRGESEERWLVRLAVVGIGGEGERRTLWSDTLVTDRP